MDIKKKIQEVVDKLVTDNKLMEKFQKNPVSVIEDLLGVDLPDDMVNKIVEGVKAQINLDKIGDALGALGSLFKK